MFKIFVGKFSQLFWPHGGMKSLLFSHFELSAWNMKVTSVCIICIQSQSFAMHHKDEKNTLQFYHLFSVEIDCKWFHFSWSLCTHLKCIVLNFCPMPLFIRNILHAFHVLVIVISYKEMRFLDIKNLNLI